MPRALSERIEGSSRDLLEALSVRHWAESDATCRLGSGGGDNIPGTYVGLGRADCLHIQCTLP